jgi:hypothetical protein
VTNLAVEFAAGLPRTTRLSKSAQIPKGKSLEKVRFQDAGPVPVECKAPQQLLVSAGDAAKMLGISERNLWSLSVAGKVPSAKIGRRRLYDPRALARFVDRCMTPETLAV